MTDYRPLSEITAPSPPGLLRECRRLFPTDWRGACEKYRAAMGCTRLQAVAVVSGETDVEPPRILPPPSCEKCGGAQVWLHETMDRASPVRPYCRECDRKEPTNETYNPRGGETVGT